MLHSIMLIATRFRIVSGTVVAALTLAVGCAPGAVRRTDTRYGPEAVRDHLAASARVINFEHDVAPIFNRRCLECHACYDAPCQLKMENFSGLDRGASPALVYNAARLLEAPLTRLGIDARTTQEWREKGFHPVLNERDQTTANDLSASVLYKMLMLKSHQPLPGGILPPKLFDFSISRKQTCATLTTMPKYERGHPQWGMPFGLPALTSAEMLSVSRWLLAGAKTEGAPPMPEPYARATASWEAFFNGDSLKERLMSRYMFEHLFLANIYFDELGTDEHFHLVRSRTPPGQPIDLIPTRRPYDDPGVARPYYRLQRNPDTLVSKTNMAYAFNAKRMERWTALFLEPDYRVDAMPGYEAVDASNPFVTYRALPVKSRYQFMLDEAQFTIMGFIKGPVCRGQIALNVIEDHFWVWFIDPDVETATNDGEFLAAQLTNLELPASEGSSNLRLLHWNHFAKIEKKYMAAKAAYDAAAYPNGHKLTLDMIWNGGGVNQSAALTVFRHFDSATVVKGLVGDEPKTAWVIDYPLLERIHYLLVAGYDVYGNVGLQLFSRLYMDFLRIGGEFNFLYFLPQEARTAALDHWYRGAEDTIAKYVAESQQLFQQDTGIEYTSTDPKHELFERLKARIGPALSHRYDLGREPLQPDVKRELSRLTAARGIPVSLLPELSMLTLETTQGALPFTLIHNDGHTNVASMFGEEKRRVPEEDTLTVVPGFLGAYPNAFFKVKQADLPSFVDTVTDLADEPGYANLMSRFGVRRTDPGFWAHSDLIFRQVESLDYPDRGVLDYSRIENR
jgi:Fatty acid cis/trans isomerase (CTI)